MVVCYDNSTSVFLIAAINYARTRWIAFLLSGWVSVNALNDYGAWKNTCNCLIKRRCCYNLAFNYGIAILTVFAILAVLTVFSVLAINAICAVNTVFTILTDYNAKVFYGIIWIFNNKLAIFVYACANYIARRIFNKRGKIFNRATRKNKNCSCKK